MHKLEESELSDKDGDEEDGSFGSASLTEMVKQPLFRKSKSQVNPNLQMYSIPMYSRKLFDLELSAVHLMPP